MSYPGDETHPPRQQQPPEWGNAPGEQQPPWQGQPKTNGLAIASLVTGILGAIFCFIVAIVGIVLGIVALNQIKNSNGMQTGRGLAIAGIVVGSLGIVVVILLIAFAGSVSFYTGGN